MKEPMELQAASVTPVSLNGTNLTATVKFRTYTFAGDNYRIKAQIVSPLLVADRTWKSGRLTVWKKFTVEVDAMDDEHGGRYYPRYDGVERLYSEAFIKLDFQDDQMAAPFERVIAPADTRDWEVPWLTWAGQYGQDTRTTTANLHLIGVRDLLDRRSLQGFTSGIHSLVEDIQEIPLKCTISAHELGHAIGWPGHGQVSDQTGLNFMQTPGMSGGRPLPRMNPNLHMSKREAQWFRAYNGTPLAP